MAGEVYQFPADLGSQQQGHYMIITAYQSQTNAGAAVGQLGQQVANVLNNALGTNVNLNRDVNTKLGTFSFFVPGGPTNGQSMVWQHGHEYTDVKLARLFTSALGVGGDIIAGAAALMGYPINPKVDVLFRNTNLREYQFMFMLAPQSKKESDILFGTGPGTGMLNRLRYHAAPTLNELSYDSPSEFEIEFHYLASDGSLQPNKSIPKIARGVIKRIDIDYTPNGEWSTFYDGSPVSALLTIAFMETKIIDKKYIQQGY